MRPRDQWFIIQSKDPITGISHALAKRPLSSAPPPMGAIFGPDTREFATRVLSLLEELRSLVPNAGDPSLEFSYGGYASMDVFEGRLSTARLAARSLGDRKPDTSGLPRSVRPVRCVSPSRTWSSARALSEHLSVPLAQVYRHLDQTPATRQPLCGAYYEWI